MKNRLIPILVIAYSITLYAQEALQKNTTTAKPSFDEAAYNWSRTFAEVLQLTNQKHYKPDNVEDSMMKSIDAFLNNLDPHSAFLGPKTYQRMMEATSGEFFGIGIMIDNTRKPEDSHLSVIETIPGGPADKANVQAMDKIVEVDGEKLAGQPTEEVTAKLKGPRNTKVNIKVMRQEGADLLDFSITRDIIKEQNSLSFHLKDQNIYYLSLSTFSENAVKQVEQLLQSYEKNQYKGLILDLRNNSGGLLNSVVDIAGLFLDKGSVVATTKDRDNKVQETYKTTREPIVKGNLPIFILTNNYTASAAEILAGDLKIHSEALGQSKSKRKLMVFLVGTTTFGKGSVQQVIPISNNSAVKITTSLYFLPNDTTIQGVGIQPDFVVERTQPLAEQVRWFTKNYGREQSFKNHIKVLSSSAAPDKEAVDTSKVINDAHTIKRWTDRSREMLQKDNQLHAAIELINLFHTAQKTCPNQVCSRAQAVAYMKQHLITDDNTLTIELVQP
jgi:carboxyl-terminal processing protease